MLVEKIKAISAALAAKTVAQRRHLHQNPELSFQEYNTAAYVKAQLAELGLEAKEIANTGLVATIQGTLAGDQVIALRADMDALPIQELNEVPYRSQVAGVMHACGHDVHTASLLGVAGILNQIKDSFGGTVKLIFQPGEEKTPGGASIMIAEGVLQSPEPKGIIGQHVMPLLPVGKVGIRPGMYMASADELYVRVIGKGGHGAMPELTIDPVVIASHIIIALQQIVSRVGNPRIPSVLTFGKVEAKGATNVIPNEVYLEGTFRTMNEEWRMKAHDRMKKMAEGIAESMGATCEFNIVKGYPVLYNDEALTSQVTEDLISFMGEENVVNLDLWMAAEDFSYYTQHIPGCFYRLGTANQERGITSGVHTPTFDIDEAALDFAPGLMAYLAIQQLQKS